MMLAIVMSTAVSRRIAFEIFVWIQKKKTSGLHGYESSVEAFICVTSKGVERWLDEMIFIDA